MKIELSHHNLDTSTKEVTSTKPLVFVMDQMAEPQGKKRKVIITTKNFGARLDIGKLKEGLGPSLQLFWRCRLLA